MRHRHPISFWMASAIPFLLLSTTQQAGIITHVNPDGSGERMVYARAASGRAPEAAKQMRAFLGNADVAQETREGDGKRVLAWRDGIYADLSKAGDIEVGTMGIVQSPLSFLYTTHTWKETLAFDRGDATDIEVHGVKLAELDYVVRMPGKITSATPAGQQEGNRVRWAVKVGSDAQTFTVESRSVRWPYLVLCIYVALFVLVKVGGLVLGIAKRMPRKPRKI